MAGREIEIAAAGRRLRAYVAVPEAGTGPGLVVLGDTPAADAATRARADYFSEEGYVALAPDGVAGSDDLAAAVAGLARLPETVGKIGALGTGRGAALAYAAAVKGAVAVAVGYDPVGVEPATVEAPATLHAAAGEPEFSAAALAAFAEAGGRRAPLEVFVYPGVERGFAERGSGRFDKPAATMAHSRTIAALRRVLGPHYDLAALWEQHCYYEFAARDVDKTMATMVAEPYVNHVPTMTGGVGAAQLARFYAHHFVNSNPKDTRLVPVSRTVGADRVVDEMLFCFTHDVEIDWMLPGVKPTGRYVEVPVVAIVNFRGGKLYHEHIYWDQASVLAQIGLLDPALLPVAGIETAKKLVDETLPSNTLMRRWSESEPA